MSLDKISKYFVNASYSQLILLSIFQSKKYSNLLKKYHINKDWSNKINVKEFKNWYKFDIKVLLKEFIYRSYF